MENDVVQGMKHPAGVRLWAEKKAWNLQFSSLDLQTLKIIQ